MQAGLKSAGTATVTYGRYQEGRIRWHRLIEGSIERGLAADGRSGALLDVHRVAEG
ncbi:MAG: hypothetical protein P8N02_07815 [Actinomycetota bacterium]|nr:hypothetical protein [Actinomycetota bacterium]